VSRVFGHLSIMCTTPQVVLLLRCSGRRKQSVQNMRIRNNVPLRYINWLIDWLTDWLIEHGLSYWWFFWTAGRRLPPAGLIPEICANLMSCKHTVRWETSIAYGKDWKSLIMATSWKSSYNRGDIWGIKRAMHFHERDSKRKIYVVLFGFWGFASRPSPGLRPWTPLGIAPTPNSWRSHWIWD